MAVTFPNSPTLNQEYVAENGLIYVWDGEKWKTAGSNNLDQNLYIEKDGTNSALFADNSRVGIGTVSPDRDFHISTTDEIGIQLGRTAEGNVTMEFEASSGTAMYCGLTTGATGWAVGPNSSLNTSSLLFIDRINGQVKVGTVGPATATNNSVIVEGRLQSNATYTSETASGSNVFIGSDGLLSRSTSSVRFKSNIETMDDSYADAILEARPVWYNSIASEDQEHPEWGYWGFIAEEVEEVDPRLVAYGKDENGELRADGVQYDRFVPHLVNLIKRQKEAIEALEARVAALEGTL